MIVRLRGFTIIELLVVVLIIGILLSAASVNFTNARIAGRDAKRISDILLIATVVDQSAALNRGNYPTSVLSPALESSCAHSLVTDESSTGNPNQIDLSVFASRSIPKDPRTASTRGFCTDYKSGYIYHRYKTSGTGPASVGSGNSSSSIKYHYVLEVGLERNKNIDESHFYNGTFFYNGSAITSPRYQFFLPGKSCGTTCQ